MGRSGNIIVARSPTVVKVGGSILKPGEVDKVVEKVIERHLMDRDGLIMVVSAMKGVTDMLINAYDRGDASLLSNAVDLYVAEAERMGIRGISNMLSMIKGRLINMLNVREPWVKDLISVQGELMSVMLIHGLLRELGIDVEAVYDPGIVTDDNWGNARVLGVSSYYVKSRLSWALSRSSVVIAPGFLGYTIEGRLTSLGRGGSDYTASLIASYMGARALYFYTDVEGILTGDPRLMEGVKVVPTLSHSEAYMASVAGAKKFHPNTFKPLLESEVKAIVTSPWSTKGTVIESTCINAPKLVSVSEVSKLNLNIGDGYAVTVVGCIMANEDARKVFYEIALSYNSSGVVYDSAGNGAVSIVKDQDDAVKLAKEYHRWVVSWIG